MILYLQARASLFLSRPGRSPWTAPCCRISGPVAMSDPPVSSGGAGSPAQPRPSITPGAWQVPSARGESVGTRSEPCLSCKSQCFAIPFPQAPEQKHPQAASESSPSWAWPCSGLSLPGPGLQATCSRNCTLCDPRQGVASAGLQVWRQGP